MNALFNDYITNIVDKAYHRLLTSDNVSKFRPEIIDRLEAKSRSRAYVEKAAAEIAGIKEISSGKAEESVYQYLHGIIDAFQNMDDNLREINQKNTQHQRSAVNRARFMLTGSEDVREQLKEIPIGMNEEINREQMNLGGIYRIDFLEELIRIYTVGCLDEKSLYSPVAGRNLNRRKLRIWSRIWNCDRKNSAGWRNNAEGSESCEDQRIRQEAACGAQ